MHPTDVPLRFSLAFRAVAAALWVALVVIAVFTSPPSSPETGTQVVKMMTGDLEGVNRSLFGLFNLMGVWPLVMLVALRGDRGWVKWPFLVGSFGLGAFVLLPYLVLRPWLAPRVEARTRVERVLASRWLHGVLLLAFVGFLGLWLFGDPDGFRELFRTQQFPYVMTFDCFAFCGVALLLGLERRLTRNGR